MPQPYSRSNPSPRFVELLEQYRAMHREGDVRRGTPAEHTFDGKSLPRQASRIKKMIERSGARTILDYGRGKGRQYLPAGIMENGAVRWNSMQEYWGVASIRCYDPGHAPFSALPEGQFDGVVCTDVLEHCPEEDLPWIVGELFGYARLFVFANVACYPAAKTLPNGENAHCTVQPASWWGETLARHFRHVEPLRSTRSTKCMFKTWKSKTLLWLPKKWWYVKETIKRRAQREEKAAA